MTGVRVMAVGVPYGRDQSGNAGRSTAATADEWAGASQDAAGIAPQPGKVFR